MIGKVNATVDFSFKTASVQPERGIAEQESVRQPKAVPEVRKLSDTIREFNEDSASANEAKRKLEEEDVEELSGALNDFMKKMNYDLHFDYRKELGRLTMKMVDRKTDEVIKEFPPEEMVNTLINIKEWIGVFLDKKV